MSSSASSMRGISFDWKFGESLPWRFLCDDDVGLEAAWDTSSHDKRGSSDTSFRGNILLPVAAILASSDVLR